MSLAPGTRLGPYEILAPLGAGGMGEVYKARDTRLDRIVAIKVLPAHVAADPAFRERFEREARLISRFDHPHICALHDVGRENGIDFLVMQYIEGETLAARLEVGAARSSADSSGAEGAAGESATRLTRRAALTVEEALRYAIQIADALDKAHRQGIIHRDLKPGNIMITKAGAKLLDFGLAKPGAVSAFAPGVSTLPTQQAPITAQGTILGTIQYMAPEQLEGHEADARSDIFAFGAVLYEMLTGRRAFEGRSHASLISAILTAQPAPIAQLLPVAPPAIDYVVSRCLAKDPDDRWQSARDLLAELKRTVADTHGTPPAATVILPARSRGRERIAWAAAGLMTIAAVAASAWTVLGLRPAPRRPVHLTLPLTPSEGLGGRFALSPDGRVIAFVARHRDATRLLYMRSLDSPTATPLPGTETISVDGAAFSPDGKWIAYTALAKLKKMPLDGGPPTILADSSFDRPSWGAGDIIVFESLARPNALSIVDAKGGEPRPLTTLDVATGELAHEDPLVLPGGRAVLYSTVIGGSTAERRVISVQGLDGTKPRALINGSRAEYLSSGHLMFVRENVLMVVGFDAERLTIVGEPQTVVNAAFGSPGSAYAAANGTLVYTTGAADLGSLGTLAFVDLGGVARPAPFPPQSYSDPRLSPDGQHLIVHLFDSARDNWVGDLRRGTLMRLTFDPSEDETPIWSLDGKSILYSSTRAGVPRAIFRKAADGSGAEERLWVGTGHVHLAGWTPDGRTLIVTAGDRPTDIQTLTLGDKDLKPVIATPAFEVEPALSPDGRWLAYVSDGSGKSEVYVQPFPALDGKWQISTNGGRQPMWARNGRQLFFRANNQMMVADVAAAPSFSASASRALFEDRYVTVQGGGHTAYDVTPDGKGFLMIAGSSQGAGPQALSIILDWSPGSRVR